MNVDLDHYAELADRAAHDNGSVAVPPAVLLILIRRIKLCHHLLVEEGLWDEPHPLDGDDPDPEDDE